MVKGIIMINEKLKKKLDEKNITVEQFKENWASSLMDMGVVVKLKMGRWSAKKTINPSDLGLKFANDDAMEFMSKYINLGTQRLLPVEVLSEITSIEQRARKNLKNYSFETVWGKFVPYSTFDEWEKKNEEIRETFFKAAKSLEYRYDEIIEMLRKEYEKLARDVWARLYHNSENPTENFVCSFVDNIISYIPSPFKLTNSFKYEIVYYEIPLPSSVQRDIENVKRIREESELESKARKKVSEYFVEQKKTVIDGFLESTVCSMRDNVKTICESVLASLQKNAYQTHIPKNSINRLKIMIEKVRKLNFYDDKQITLLLNSLELEIGKYKGEMDKNVVKETLEKIVEESSTEYFPDDFDPAIESLKII